MSTTPNQEIRPVSSSSALAIHEPHGATTSDRPSLAEPCPFCELTAAMRCSACNASGTIEYAAGPAQALLSGEVRA